MEHIVKGAHDKIVQTIEAMIRMSWHQKSPESTPTGLGIEAMFSYGHIWTHMITYGHIWSAAPSLILTVFYSAVYTELSINTY